MIFFDTNVLIDLFRPLDSDSIQWSNARYAQALREGTIGCSIVVFAELSAKADRPGDVTDRLAAFEIDLIDLSAEAAFRAGRAFAEYRRRGGTRTTILADFLIAGHAATVGDAFVTRDRRLGSYFPELTFITPETHAHG